MTFLLLTEFKRLVRETRHLGPRKKGVNKYPGNELFRKNDVVW